MCIFSSIIPKLAFNSRAASKCKQVFSDRGTKVMMSFRGAVSAAPSCNLFTMFCAGVVVTYLDQNVTITV